MFVLTPVLQAACYWQDRRIRSKFPGRESCCHMVGDAVMLENKEITASIELGGLPEEVGKVIQWYLLASSLGCY